VSVSTTRDADRLLDLVVTRDARRCPSGRAWYRIACNTDAGMLMDPARQRRISNSLGDGKPARSDFVSRRPQARPAGQPLRRPAVRELVEVSSAFGQLTGGVGDLARGCTGLLA
jgi:hypothetical protein